MSAIEARARSFPGDARGSVAVETGLVGATFVLMLLGTIELGNAFWQWNRASKALQLGARLAAVTDPVSSDLKTLTGLSASVDPGDPMPYYARVCSGATQTCSGGTYDAVVMRSLVYGRGNTSCPATAQTFATMCGVFPRIRPENLVVEYVSTGLGFAGRPYGPVPTITLRLTGLTFDFLVLNRLAGLGSIPMSGLSTTATAEDLSGR